MVESTKKWAPPEVERSFPGITHRLPPREAIDLIMEDLIPSKKARCGISIRGTLNDIRCYKKWLLRVKRGTDPKFPAVVPQPHINNIDIAGKLLAFYQKYGGNGGGGV